MQQQTKGNTGVLRGHGVLTDRTCRLEWVSAMQAVQPGNMGAIRMAQGRAGIARLNLQDE